MGDRGNICMLMRDGNRVYFYTHWTGSQLKKILIGALTRGKSRWDDEPYLARIIFSEMIQNNVMGLEDYGISSYKTDNEHPIYYVDIENQEVTVEDVSYAFEDFIENKSS